MRSVRGVLRRDELALAAASYTTSVIDPGDLRVRAASLD
jgi:hypothetical protein